MPENYEIVPWFNREEWLKVYQELSAENSNKENVLNLLKIWKARAPSLPSGIESTMCLLEVYVQDVQSVDTTLNDQILRLAYSSAIMRFVNHMFDSETAKGLSLYNAAKNAGVPDWIVELRHDAAHNHNLPSLTLLRNACQISLQWLQKNYWDHHVLDIHDFCHNIDENKIVTMIYLLSCLSISTHSKIKKIADIPDSNMQKSIINDIKVLFNDLHDPTDYEAITITSVINLLDANAKTILKDIGFSYYVNKALIEEHSLILSMELLDYLSKKDFNNNKLNKNFVLSFEVLLTFLHTHDLILDFILSLIKLTQTDDYPKNKLAALWVAEILAALKASKQFVGKASRMDSTVASSEKKNNLKQLYRHWFPSENVHGLILDLQKPVPSQLTDINFIQPIISSYNPYLVYFVKNLLDLVEPQLPKQSISRICELAKLISAPEMFPAENQRSLKIFTVQDLDTGENFANDNVEREKPIADVINCQQLGIWKIAPNYNWRLCPIGKSPCTQEQNLDVEME